MATKIRDIENEITGAELKNSTNEAYFPVDIDDDLTYKINGDELIDFIIGRGQQEGLEGKIVNKNVGYHSGRVMVNGTDIYEGSILTCGGGMVQPVLPNSAFNKNFSNAGGTNGTTQVVARADHTHAELASISLKNNSHIAVFVVKNSTVFPITEQMLLDKMNYGATSDINPAIGYTIWNRVGDYLVDITSDFDSLQVEYQTGNKPPSQLLTYYRFKEFVIPSLNSAKSYVIKINFVDDGGMAIPVGESGS